MRAAYLKYVLATEFPTVDVNVFTIEIGLQVIKPPLVAGFIVSTFKVLPATTVMTPESFAVNKSAPLI